MVCIRVKLSGRESCWIGLVLWCANMILCWSKNTAVNESPQSHGVPVFPNRMKQVNTFILLCFVTTLFLKSFKIVFGFAVLFHDALLCFARQGHSPEFVIALTCRIVYFCISGGGPIVSNWLFASAVTCRETVCFGFLVVQTKLL